jgi:hypothetical protein
MAPIFFRQPLMPRFLSAPLVLPRHPNDERT